MRQSKELNQRSVLIILITEQLVTAKIDENQESSLLIRLIPADWKFRLFKRTQKVDRKQETHKQKNTTEATKDRNGTVWNRFGKHQLKESVPVPVRNLEP